jgi:hypothetical protein
MESKDNSSQDNKDNSEPVQGLLQAVKNEPLENLWLNMISRQLLKLQTKQNVSSIIPQ